MARAPGFDQQHTVLCIFAQSCRQGRPGRSGADDNVIILFHKRASPPTRGVDRHGPKSISVSGKAMPFVASIV